MNLPEIKVLKKPMNYSPNESNIRPIMEFNIPDDLSLSKGVSERGSPDFQVKGWD